MTTTAHPLARDAEETLRHVAHLLFQFWGTRRGGVEKFGLPEAILEATQHDPLTRIVAQRALVSAGVDVWWNDLLCTSALEAQAAVLGVASTGVDLEELYGPNYEPIVGILKAAVLMDAQRLGACGHQLIGTGFSRLFDEAFEAARAYDCDALMSRVLSDVLFACHKDGSTTPAAHERLLHGARVLELAAAWYVLDGGGAVPDAALLEPIKRALWPHLPNLKGGAS